MSDEKKLREGILKAVSMMDESDGSCFWTAQTADDARQVLSETYGDNFKADLKAFYKAEWTTDTEQDKRAHDEFCLDGDDNENGLAFKDGYAAALRQMALLFEALNIEKAIAYRKMRYGLDKD